MKSLKQLAAVLAGIFIFIACQKEMSFETQSNFAGAVMGDTNGCFPVIKKGQYIRDSVLTDSSYVLVKVDVASPGLYNISTNQNNGFYFVDSGFLVNTGVQYLKLKAIGRPIVSTLTHFDITFNSITGCSFDVLVTDSAVYYAAFTYRDNFGNCLGDSVTGIYDRGTPLNSTNTLMLQVNVQSPGLYDITAGPQNGMVFHTSGSFVNTGIQTVILPGTGTPDSAGSIIMGPDTSVCGFLVPVNNVDYFPTTNNSNWTYQVNTTGDTNRVTALTTNKTIGGTAYREFLGVSPTYGIDTFYYRKGNGSYYEYGNMNPPNPVSIYDTVYGAIDFLFLKDNAAPGDTWTSDSLTAVLIIPTQPSDTGKAKIRFTIVAKNVTTMVGTVSVDTVIQVKREYLFTSSTGTVYPLGSADFYYGRNKGFLKAETASPATTIYATRWQIF